MPFNKTLWEYGRKIEDEALPKLNKHFKTNFLRNDNDIFDIFDFTDEEKKMIVEVKGRKIASDKYDETLITSAKVMAAQQKMDDGYRVFLLFVFTDCSKIIELKPDMSFKCKLVGYNCVQHYLIPIADLTDFDDYNVDNDPIEEIELEPEPEPEPELKTPQLETTELEETNPSMNGMSQ